MLLLGLFVFVVGLNIGMLIATIKDSDDDGGQACFVLFCMWAIPLCIGFYKTHFTANVEVYEDNKLIYKGNSAHVSVNNAGNKTDLKLSRVGFFSIGDFYHSVSDKIIVKTTTDKNKWVWFGDDERK